MRLRDAGALSLHIRGTFAPKNPPRPDSADPHGSELTDLKGLIIGLRHSLRLLFMSLLFCNFRIQCILDNNACRGCNCRN